MYGMGLWLDMKLGVGAGGQGSGGEGSKELGGAGGGGACLIASLLSVSDQWIRSSGGARANLGYPYGVSKYRGRWKRRIMVLPYTP